MQKTIIACKHSFHWFYLPMIRILWFVTLQLFCCDDTRIGTYLVVSACSLIFSWTADMAWFSLRTWSQGILVPVSQVFTRVDSRDFSGPMLLSCVAW